MRGKTEIVLSENLELSGEWMEFSRTIKEAELEETRQWITTAAKQITEYDKKRNK
mgnify:CR=1 FL=1